jgi:peptide chain release factor subunit 1
MLKATSHRIEVHDDVIRPSLVAELEAFRAADLRVSSYYLNIDPKHWGNNLEALRRSLKKTLDHERARIEKMDWPHNVRSALLRDSEKVAELAPTVVGDRRTLAVACFVASENRYARALRLPWPVRDRIFVEDRFVLWPLQQVLDQSDRYGVILCDKDEARVFLFYLEAIEEVLDIVDEIPGRIRFPDPYRELEYMRKNIEYAKHHFDRVSEQALRLVRKEPFEHLIIGGLWETLPQFENHLHRYLRDRIVARWKIDVRTPTQQILERARQEEQEFLRRQAEETWKSTNDLLPQRGALEPEPVFSALWQKRVQSLLVEPNVARSGFRCSVCSRLRLSGDPCIECGGKMVKVEDVFDEAVQETIDQSGHVRYWDDPALHAVDLIAALRRF